MKNKKDLILGIALIFTLFFLTIGYALYDEILTLNGNVLLGKPGTVEIISIQEYPNSSTLPEGAGSLVLKDGKIELDYSFTVSQEEPTYEATYLISLKNNSPYDYIFSGFSMAPSIKIDGATEDEAGAVLTYEYASPTDVSNLVGVGGTIPSGEPGVVAITIHFRIVSEKNNTNITINGGADVNTSTDNSGTFYAGIVDAPVTLDLTNDTIDDNCFKVDVTNTYNTQIIYNFTLTGSNFVLVDRNGGSLGDFTIAAPSETRDSNVAQVELCIMASEGSQFANDTAQTQVVINPTGLSSFSTGTLTIKVEKSEDVTGAIPRLENVTFEAVKYDTETTSLNTKVTWSRIVETGELDIKNWYIQLYNEPADADTTTTLITTFTVDGSANTSNYELAISNNILTSTAFTNALNNGDSFYVKIYGVDELNYSGEASCSLSDGNNYCVASTSTSLKYQFTLKYTGNATLSNTDTTNKTATIYLNNAFTSVITSSTNYTLNGVTVTRATSSENLATNEYTYALEEGSSTVANFQILENVVNDDINITINTYNNDWICLIKGTKIKVYNGYKNIEDIKYDDLLEVYSYDLGRVVYEYPIKIEEEGKASNYQRITFSDGSILNTYGPHGIFSKDLNRYVSVLDRQSFDVGTTVLKLENGKLKEVKVVKLEEIIEDTTYYHVASTRYLNVFANDFLTTDPILPISNIFSFNDDLTWGSDREEYLKTNDFISYEMLKNYFPKYLYEGIRMGEAKHLINQGIISVEEYVTKFSKMSFIPIPTDGLGNNKWMVTTSLDLENGLKGDYYQEGSFYELPNAKNYFDKKFLGWYNTADNKYYQEGDLVEVKYGMYFEAIYEDDKLFDKPILK